MTEKLAQELCPAPYIGQGVLAPALLAATAAETDTVLMARGELRYCVLLAADLTRIAGPDEPAVAFDAVGATHGLTRRRRRGLRRHGLARPSGRASLDRTRSAPAAWEATWRRIDW